MVEKAKKEAVAGFRQGKREKYVAHDEVLDLRAVAEAEHAANLKKEAAFKSKKDSK